MLCVLLGLSTSKCKKKKLHNILQILRTSSFLQQILLFALYFVAVCDIALFLFLACWILYYFYYFTSYFPLFLIHCGNLYMYSLKLYFFFCNLFFVYCPYCTQVAQMPSILKDFVSSGISISTKVTSTYQSRREKYCYHLFCDLLRTVHKIPGLRKNRHSNLFSKYGYQTNTC